MNKLMDKLKKTSTIKETAILMKSKIYNQKDMIQTYVPMINVALSGSVDGGLTPGVTVLAGPSKHFKSAFALIMAAAYQQKYSDGVILFYDSEFGTPTSYYETFGVDKERVIHTPITDAEQLKHDIMTQLKNIERGDKICIIVDSIGNLASKKEVEDAIEGNSVADMTRAKAFKSLFRMITPHLTLKDIPLIAINHTYKEIGKYPKDIVSGGCVISGTEIIMADGSIKPIEMIEPGEFVKTTFGSKEVSHTWNPNTLEDGNPECYEIIFDDGHKIVCSENHMFLVSGTWIKAKDLTEDIEVDII